jgi:hypothetical protein
MEFTTTYQQFLDSDIMQKLLSFKRILCLAKNQSTGLKNCSIFFWAKFHQTSALNFFDFNLYKQHSMEKKNDPNQPDFERIFF